MKNIQMQWLEFWDISKEYLGKDFSFQKLVTWMWKHTQMLTGQVVWVTWGLLLSTVHLLETIWWRGEAKNNPLWQDLVQKLFRSIVLGILELLWLKSLLKELKMENDKLMKLYWKNKAAISISQSSATW